MGLMNELKKFARPYAEDEEDFDEEYEDEVEETLEAEEEEKPARTARAPKAERTAPKQTAARPAANNNTGNVVNFRSGTNLQVILVKPEKFEGIRDVADHLRNKCAVVLNLEQTDKATAARMVDFLSGCAYALDGNMQDIATSTYIITPFNVDVVGNLSNLKEELKNSGVY